MSDYYEHKLAEAEDTIEERDAEILELKAHVERLREALKDLVDAEWMVSHDWGGDRESVLDKANKALKEDV